MGVRHDIDRRIVFGLHAILFLLFIFLITPVFAQPNGDLAVEEILGADVTTRDDALVGFEEELPSVGVFNILLALVFVLVIIWLVSRYILRPLLKGVVMGKGVEEFRIIASLPTAPTKSIQVIKLVDRLLVVSVGDGGMRLLTEITDPEEVSEMIKSLDENDPSKYHPFKQAFETLLSRKKESGFEDRQSHFNKTLGNLKEKLDAMKDVTNKK